MRERLSIWLTLTAYAASLWASHALHVPHLGDSCSAGACAAPALAGRNCADRHEHACHAPGHAHPADNPDVGTAPRAPSIPEDECGFCRFLALAPWTGPAAPAVGPPRAVTPVPPPHACRPFVVSIALPPVRGPPAASRRGTC